MFVAALLVGLVSGMFPPVAPIATAQDDPRYFAETGFRVGNDRFWDYFQRRGGVRTFGYPDSREFQLQGFRVQFFQRGVLQLWPDGSVKTLNLLDEGLLPYTQINGSTFPAAQRSLANAAPRTTDPEYARRIVEFTYQVAPDTWQGLPVNFFQTFMSTVTRDDVFPGDPESEDVLALLNLEIWGVPTSEPARDPNNPNFVYQRFQRGIAHYDHSCRCTQGILLGDALKSVLTGRDLPPDLEEQARTSPFYRQYNPSLPGSLRAPELLAATNLSGAFEREAPAAGAAPAPVAPPATTHYRARSPEYGMNVFLAENATTTARDLNLLTQVGFGWQKSLFPWRDIEGAGKGIFDWRESDRVVAASQRAGVKIIARLDFQPRWARADGAHNGPPDYYQDYADFVYAFVDRYKAGSPRGTVQAVQIWNEPNLDREWGNVPITPAEAVNYVALLRAGYTAAKQADPTVTVISAGLSPTCTNSLQARPDDVYLQWMYDAGAARYFDVLGAHGAGYDKPPSASPDESAARHGGCRVFTFRRVEDLREVMVAKGDGNKQVWLLEFGWTTDQVNPAYAWHAISPEAHGEYVVEAFRFAHRAWSPWIGVMVLWNLPDPRWGPEREEYWWAVTNPDGSPRPAYTRLLTGRREGVLP